MILRIVICFTAICISSMAATDRCLTGYMTDVQNWVTKEGNLTGKHDDEAVDLSCSKDAVQQLRELLMTKRRRQASVQQLSLAKCGFTTVPKIFRYHDSEGRALSQTLRYLTLYSNNFHDSSEPSDLYLVNFNATNTVSTMPITRQESERNERWGNAFKHVEFLHLRELDLRSCSIRTIEENIFAKMPSLEALYLGENHIMHIEAEAFNGLDNLLYLDISNNEIHSSFGPGTYIQIDSEHIFKPLKNLGSLDLSKTKLTQANVGIFQSLSNSLRKLSICEVGISSLNVNTFNSTPLKYLDVSGNTQIMSISNQQFIDKLCSSLVVLFADHVGLQSLEIFKHFYNLEILKITDNAVSVVPAHVMASLKSLKFLDLLSNRVPSWFGPIYTHMPQLMFLNLRRNNLNMISDAMISDLSHVNYIGLSDNYFVCSCQVREFLEIAIYGEFFTNSQANDSQFIAPPKLGPTVNQSSHYLAQEFHTGFLYFEELINRRVALQTNSKDLDNRTDDEEASDRNSSFLLFDFSKHAYSCYIVNEDSKWDFAEVAKCNNGERNIPYDDIMQEQITSLVLMISIPLVVFSIVAVVLFRRWWCVKYFFITVKNSAMLSIIGNEEKSLSAGEIYHYDVFVSYCNDDRAWVLDQLLPHVEADCNVSVCLHERDFQVGLSILENIVSCMDRSRAIMLVISNKFLLSQWCQFEMHLAQHRLLETRREDLILVLLEDVPRRKRPHTLHYLMMTKTYIVWPESKAGREQFWRRMKRSLTQNGNTLREVSTA